MYKILRQRNFVLLLSGQVISSVGDWVLWIVLPFYVYEQTGSALATGAMFIVNNLPTIFFGSLAGVFVDQWDRRRTMLGADLLRAGLLLLLLPAYFLHAIWLVYPVAFLLATVAQFFSPAKSAIIPSLVVKEELLLANTFNSIGGDLAMLAGPAVGGILFAWLGFTGVVLIDGASFLLSGLLIYGIALPPQPSIAAAGKRLSTPSAPWLLVWHDWLIGLRLVKASAAITAIFLFTGLTMVGNGIILVMWAIYVKTHLHGGPLEYGWIQVAVALGGLGGALLLPRIQPRVSPRLLIGVSGCLVGLLLLTTFHFPVLWVIMVLQLAVGSASVGFYVASETLLQTSSTFQYLGRIFGAYNTTNAIAILGGQLLASALADQIGLVAMLDLAACFTIASGIAAWLALPARETIEMVADETR